MVAPVEQQQEVPISGWAGVQRRLRSLVPKPVRRADLALFRAVARTDLPLVGRLLPPLSNAANKSRLWMAIAALLAADGRTGRRAGVRGILAVGLTSAVTNLPAKFLAGRVRPDLSVVPEIRRLARVPASTSFPSGHSASAFAFAVGATLEAPRLRYPLLALAGAVATSRVYTGVHYPGDALVGSAIGVAVARATTRPWPLAQREPATGTRAREEEVRELGPDGTGLTLVVNPAAGHRLARRRVAHVLDTLPGAQVVRLDPDGDLEEVLRRAAQDARVLGVAGGDGTVNAAAAVVREVGTPLAIVPTGTFNHFAKDIGIADEHDAMAALRAGRPAVVDVGEVGGRPFLNAASIGAYAELVSRRQHLERRVGKWPAMVAAAAWTFRHGEPLDVEIDGQRRRAWLLFVGNGRFSADGIAPARRRRLDDGLLDVRLVPADVPAAKTRVTLAGLAGRLPQARTYEGWTAEELRVRSFQGPLLLARDGELERDADAFTVRKDRRAVTVLQPDPAGAGRPR